MSNDRRLWLKGLAALPLAGVLPVAADELDAIRKRGRLRIAVYNDFPPYSANAKGIDAEVGRALAEKLGLTAEVVGFNADEDMSDDLRNMVWKGHYLGTQPADVMMHVPVDEHLAKQN
ncbi:MAG TPA: ABC transporter substrate-binding protein, partial [Rhodocyclaceae bacterium]|nr:ABC transporter substrate-binding protein [Rhodocyclaceae bacterium]